MTRCAKTQTHSLSLSLCNHSKTPERRILFSVCLVATVEFEIGFTTVLTVFYVDPHFQGALVLPWLAESQTLHVKSGMLPEDWPTLAKFRSSASWYTYT
jgi:hypothetical protein